MLSQQPVPWSVLNNFEMLYTKDKNKKCLVLRNKINVNFVSRLH